MRDSCVCSVRMMAAGAMCDGIGVESVVLSSLVMTVGVSMGKGWDGWERETDRRA